MSRHPGTQSYWHIGWKVVSTRVLLAMPPRSIRSHSRQQGFIKSERVIRLWVVGLGRCSSENTKSKADADGHLGATRTTTTRTAQKPQPIIQPLLIQKWPLPPPSTPRVQPPRPHRIRHDRSQRRRLSCRKRGDAVNCIVVSVRASMVPALSCTFHTSCAL